MYINIYIIILWNSYCTKRTLGYDCCVSSCLQVKNEFSMSTFKLKGMRSPWSLKNILYHDNRTSSICWWRLWGTIESSTTAFKCTWRFGDCLANWWSSFPVIKSQLGLRFRRRHAAVNLIKQHEVCQGMICVYWWCRQTAGSQLALCPCVWE